MWMETHSGSSRFDRIYGKYDNNDQCLEVIEKRKAISDKKIRKLILKKFDIELALLHDEQVKNQTEVLKYLKKLNGSSLRQLSRLTGFTVNKIFRA